MSRPRRKSSSPPSGTSKNPAGLAIRVASLAMTLFRAAPTETVMPSSFSTRRFMSRAASGKEG